MSQTETHPHFPKPLVFGRWCLGPNNCIPSPGCLKSPSLAKALWKLVCCTAAAQLLPCSYVTLRDSKDQQDNSSSGGTCLFLLSRLSHGLAPGAPFQCPHTGMSNSPTGDISGLQSGLQLLLQKTGGLLQVPYGICKLCADSSGTRGHQTAIFRSLNLSPSRPYSSNS